MPGAWDLTALVNAADSRAPRAERHLWFVRLFEWLRHAPASALGSALDSDRRTPVPLLRLRHLLNQLEAHPELQGRVRGLWLAFWQDVDSAALLADFGFQARGSLPAELWARLRARWLPLTPDTRDLAALFRLFAQAQDARWLGAIDEALRQRLATLLATPHWRERVLEAITISVSAVHAAAHAPALRQRMDPALLAGDPFGLLVQAAAALRQAVREERHADALREATLLRALLDRCRQAAGSVAAHLEAYGVSADIVFGTDQLVGRTQRIEQLLDCVLAPTAAAAAAEWQRLLLALIDALSQQRGVRALLAQTYSLLARQVAERNAETGEHYITRSRDEYRDMLRRAAGGGAVIAGTTYAKLGIGALGLGPFWTGFWSGAAYAASFLIVMLLHWTVATKQPAMTAPALAAALAEPGSGAAAGADSAAIETFVDRVVQLIRSQAAGIFGNLALCAPLVLVVQWIWQGAFGQPLLGEEKARQVLESLTLLGPTALFAAFTGVLLFASSLFAGWVENWFAFHRLDSALAWNPRIVAALGASRARRWADWWRAHISGVAANVSLGMMLGLVPALLSFFGIALDVRHVTLATGQLAAAAATLGPAVLLESGFWWCVAGIAAIGVLNVGVSFWLAFKVALRSRGVRVQDRSRIGAALRRRLLSRPASFMWPPREAGRAALPPAAPK